VTNTQYLADFVLNIGQKMLNNGAEIYRVEDTITRICNAYGAISVDIFVITSSIVLTFQMEGENPHTQTRRIFYQQRTDLDYLNSLNEFSRKICTSTPDVHTLNSALEHIPHQYYPSR